jgi:hypothetical protein
MSVLQVLMKMNIYVKAVEKLFHKMKVIVQEQDWIVAIINGHPLHVLKIVETTIHLMEECVNLMNV